MKATMQSVHANRAGSLWSSDRGADWRERAACKDYPVDQGDPFHPAIAEQRQERPGVAEAYNVARSVCRRCRVTVECLTFALNVEMGLGSTSRAGVYGGLTPRERTALAKKQDPDLSEAIKDALFGESPNRDSERRARARIDPCVRPGCGHIHEGACQCGCQRARRAVPEQEKRTA